MLEQQSKKEFYILEWLVQPNSEYIIVCNIYYDSAPLHSISMLLRLVPALELLSAQLVLKYFVPVKGPLSF